MKTFCKARPTDQARGVGVIQRVALFVLISVQMMFPAQAQTPYADFINNPQSQTVGVGDQFSVTIQVAPNGSPVSVAEVHLNFNPGLVQVVSLTPALSSPLNLELPITAFDNTAGTIAFGAFRLLAPYPTATFDFLTIQFEAVGATTGTQVTHELSNFPVSLISFSGQNVLNTATPVDIIVVGCQGDPLTGDADGDGYCNDVDCDDNDPSINPGAAEICDGVDNNCDGNVDDLVDCCTTQLSLFGDPIAPGQYQASDEITSGGKVDPGTSVIFRAGNKITLLPGFHAKAGSSFLATIENCAVPPASRLTTATLMEHDDTNIASPSATEGLTVQVFPNPFSGQTKIRYRIAQPSVVTIRIADFSGRLVKVPLQEASMPEGIHEITFQADGLPSGIYFINIAAGREIKNQRVVLVE